MKIGVQLTETAKLLSPQMSPVLSHVFPAPVVYAVSLPPPRRKNGLWKIHTWILVALVTAAFVLFGFSFTTSFESRRRLFLSTDEQRRSILAPHSSTDESQTNDTPNNLYGVVFDAGSTGSRVHVFQLSRRKASTDGSYMLTDELFRHVQPGLSSYAEKPREAAESLEPLLKASLERLPNGVCSYTPVILKATAGLRLLSANKADNILAAVRQKFSQTCLAQSSNAVAILDGNLEGLYLWISLNFMTNRMPSPTDASSLEFNALGRTVGTLDLGGGSTQITFAPINIQTLVQAPEGFATDVVSGETVGKNDLKLGKHVYSRSYLGLGLMSARYSMLHTMTKRLPARFRLNGELFSPCIPLGASVDWSHGGHAWKVNYLSQSEFSRSLLESELTDARSSLELDHSSPILNMCYAQALQVLRDPIDGDHAAAAYPPYGYIVHRPKEILSQQFYAFSYIFDLATSVGLIKSQSGQQIAIVDLRDAADRICRNPNSDNPFQCMDLSYITALLHDGYGFPWNKTITLQKKIDSFEISWGLGALFAELSSRRAA